jgi:hypothetical protein
MSTQPFPLSLFCDVTVSVSPQGAVTPSFNQGLHIGNSGRIPTIGTNSRLRQYAAASFPANVTADSFLPTDPEYLALAEYFAQVPQPQFGWIGAQDPTAIAAVTIGATPGTDYVVGDIVGVTSGSASGAQVKVTAVSEGGIPTAVQLIAGGTEYAVGNNYATTGGTGTALTVDVTAVGETALQALTACRLASPAFYNAMVATPGTADADHTACLAFAQTATPQMQYLFGTDTAAVLDPSVTTDIFSLAKAAGYSRGNGAYFNTQGGNAPNNPFIAAAVSGRACGLNTGLASSAFSLDAKNLVGIIPENIDLTQLGALAGIPGQGTGKNGNVYINVANTYNFYVQGVNCSGVFYDQILGLDMLAADAQLSIVGVLATLPVVPNDNAGQALILNAALGACSRSAARGFLAGGVWSGQTILNVAPGTALPLGYLAQSALFSTQSQGQRAVRAGMPVYLTVILAGSQQSFTIGINVQQ